MIWRRGRDTRSQLMSNSCKKRVKRITYFLWVVSRFRIGVNKAVYIDFLSLFAFLEMIRFFRVVTVFFKITFIIIFLAFDALG